MYSFASRRKKTGWSVRLSFESDCSETMKVIVVELSGMDDQMMRPALVTIAALPRRKIFRGNMRQGIVDCRKPLNFMVSEYSFQTSTVACDGHGLTYGKKGRFFLLARSSNV
jgi:hypothetical protein